MTPMNEVTHILSGIEAGDPHAAEQLLPLVYDELRRLAAQKLAREKPGQTPQATALVHEAYLRLVDEDQVRHWDSRGTRSLSAWLVLVRLEWSGVVLDGGTPRMARRERLSAQRQAMARWESSPSK